MLISGAASTAQNQRMTAAYVDAGRATTRKQLDAFAARRHEAQRVRWVHERKHAPLVDADLQALLAPQVYARCRFEAGIDVTTNVMNEILAKVLREFSAPLAVGIEGPVLAEDVPGAAAFLDALDVEEIAHCLRAPHYLYSDVCAFIRMRPEQDKRELCVDILTPESFFTVCGDDGETAALVLVDEIPDGRGVMLPRYTVWTPNEVTVLLDRGRRDLETWSTDVNPYGCIPAVIFKGLGEGCTLAALAVQESTALTWLRISALAQVKILGGEFDEKFQAGQVGGQGMLLNYGSGENFQIVDFQTNEQAWHDVHVKFPRKQAANAAGLPPDELEAPATAASGVELRMRYLTRDERVLARQARLVDVLRDIVERAWWVSVVEAQRMDAPPMDDLEYQGANVVLPPLDAVPVPLSTPELVRMQAASEGYRLVINPGEMPLTETEAEYQARVKFELDGAFTTPVHVMMERDPDLSPDDALRRWLENRKFNEAMKLPFNVAEALRALPK